MRVQLSGALPVTPRISNRARRRALTAILIVVLGFAAAFVGAGLWFVLHG